ncbi:MAG TPA: DUF6756 family protein [Methylotenera sp.]|nr:DUF6756 family protein [Methylotenera sp.]
MQTIIDEISAALKTLGLDTEAVRPLPALESEKIYLSALNHFVASGDRRWWWEDFRNSSISVKFENGDAWKHLPELTPNPDELVWFIAEEDQLPYYPVFETTPKFASQIIGECHGFEYYLIAKNLDWLVCETHHDCVFAVGEEVEQRLKTYAA